MQDIIVGLLASGVGALFCFRGAVAMRIMIMPWGTFVGFMPAVASMRESWQSAADG